MYRNDCYLLNGSQLKTQRHVLLLLQTGFKQGEISRFIASRERQDVFSPFNRKQSHYICSK